MEPISTIHLAPGDYAETVNLPPGTRLVGSGQGLTRIMPNRASMEAQGNVAISAGEGTSIESLSIVLPLDVADGARLLSIVDTSVTVRDVELNGQFATGSIGVYVRGAASSDSLITDCTIQQVEVALDSALSSARFAYNDILDIRGDAAVQIFQSTGATPIVGNLDDLTTSGSNIFSNIDNDFFKTLNVDETALAQANAWENLANEAAILNQIEGSVDVTNPLYTDTGKGQFAATIIVTVLNDGENCPVSGARVTLNANARATLNESTEDGVYIAAAVPTGRFTVRVQATGYDDAAQVLNASPGINNLTVPLVSRSGEKVTCDPVEGEGLADGEGAPEGETTMPPTAAEARQDLATNFDAADTDRDGLLSFAEAVAQLPGLTQGIFNALDTDGTGALARAELQTGGCGCTGAKGVPYKSLGDYLLLLFSSVVLVVWTRQRIP